MEGSPGKVKVSISIVHRENVSDREGQPEHIYGSHLKPLYSYIIGNSMKGSINEIQGNIERLL